MKGQIAVTKETRKHLEKIFCKVERTIFNALSDQYDENNDLHRRIRKAALECGGKYVVTLPMVETIHTADGIMEQFLPNGAVLRFYREDGRGEIWYRDELVKVRENVTIKDIYEMQEEASELGKSYERAV